MTRTALVTGVSGQDGSYLAELLLAKGYRVAGTVERIDAPHPDYFAPIAPRVELHALDVRDAAGVVAVVRETRPNEVYHLAAMSAVGASWNDPVTTADVTGMGAARMLEATRREVPGARFLLAGSCEVFGRAAETPQRESTPPRPLSPYGAAKLFAQQTTALYREHFGLHASVAILFNHESPRRAPSFVTRKITQGVARIASGRAKTLSLGNLDAVRDWGFAGDYVEAMWRMLQHPDPADLVIASGEGHSVREFCELAFRSAGLDPAAHVVIDPALVRPHDAPTLIGDASQARARLGWAPAVSFHELVRIMVEADLHCVERH